MSESSFDKSLIVKKETPTQLPQTKQEKWKPVKEKIQTTSKATMSTLLI